MAELTVKDLLDEERFGLGLEVVAGAEGLARGLMSDQLASAGLQLTGFFEHFHSERLQILGPAEETYLENLSAADLGAKSDGFLRRKPVAVVFTHGADVPVPFKKLADDYEVPVLRTEMDATAFTALASRQLEEALSPTTTIHGVLLDVLGVGVLITGESGIGKSEVALDLILRGHRFVADDVVEIRRAGPGTLVGRGAELIRHHIEVRGLGILNVKDIFGVASVRERKKIEVLMEFIPWGATDGADRAGLDEEQYEILGVKIPHLKVPVSPGRSMSSIVEVAARNQLLRFQGIHSAKEFQEKLLEDLAERAALLRRTDKDAE